MGEMTDDLLNEEASLEASALPWNESNPEWWKLQVEYRGEIAWQWLVKEWEPLKQMADALSDLVAQLDHARGGALLEYEIENARELLNGEWARPRMVMPRLWRRRERERGQAERGRFCEDRMYSGPHEYARCIHYATGYQRQNDIYVCGVHARAYLRVEPLPAPTPASPRDET